jgi:adenylate cyclase
MNLPPNIDPRTAYSDNDVVHWLTNDTGDERFIDNIFAELCVRLQQAGIPVKRASLHLLIQHPQWLGARVFWADGMREATITRVDYDVRKRSEYIGSPVEEIHDGATEIRENLECDPSLGRKHGVYDELRSKGLTDYVAWPMYHTLGKRHVVAFSTDRPGGFDEAHIASLSRLLPILALASQRNPSQKPAGANAARNLCRVACRRAHPGRCHQARKRDDGMRGNHDLRFA